MRRAREPVNDLAIASRDNCQHSFAVFPSWRIWRGPCLTAIGAGSLSAPYLSNTNAVSADTKLALGKGWAMGPNVHRDAPSRTVVLARLANDQIWGVSCCPRIFRTNGSYRARQPKSGLSGTGPNAVVFSLASSSMTVELPTPECQLPSYFFARLFSAAGYIAALHNVHIADRAKTGRSGIGRRGGPVSPAQNRKAAVNDGCLAPRRPLPATRPRGLSSPARCAPNLPREARKPARRVLRWRCGPVDAGGPAWRLLDAIEAAMMRFRGPRRL
jgi:hypothetical protein